MRIFRKRRPKVVRTINLNTGVVTLLGAEPPSAFYDDLAEDLKDPEFKAEYLKAFREMREVKSE